MISKRFWPNRKENNMRNTYDIMTPARLRKEVMSIVEPVSYEKRWCNKEKTVRTHAIDNRTAEVMCLNCGDLR